MRCVPRETSPHRFSSDADRRHVFERTAAPSRQTEIEDGDWINLYDLLEVESDTSTRDLDEAIIERGADVVYFTFARAGKPPRVKLLEKYLHDMRPILLDPAARRRYNEQLRLHQSGDPNALRYEDFKRTLDIREEAGSCLSTLLFLLGAPLLFWAVEKMIAAKFI